MKEIQLEKFDWLKLELASPEKILSWSSGPVEKAETINYRTQKSERGGLFDEKIFGPEKDYECYCGKYKGIRYKGIICERCGVEITKSIARRRRMGHIELASPVAHIWYLRSVPSRMSLILNIPMMNLEKVIYFAGYLIVSVDEDKRKEIMTKIDEEYKQKVVGLKDEEDIDKLKTVFKQVKTEINSIVRGEVFDELTHQKYSKKFEGLYTSQIGSEAIYNLMKDVDMKKLEKSLEKSLETAPALEKVKLRKRITLVRSMVKSGVRPEWMFFSRIPVTPPALRPIVALGGGRHASSDVNDLYRRVINRNNRLKKLINIGAPDVILRNEKRILQEAVDSLIDNSMRRSTASAAMSAAQRRPLKSLTDNIKGKQGIFRQNLLGKRVDYSGRSVIVVGPELKIDEVGIPKKMALELFRPFIISKLILNDYAHNIKIANRFIDESEDIVWQYLEEVIKNKYVLLNRAPTLHKLGILAFKPILNEGLAIRLHPLVCSGFNADFDGDQMAVHLPISVEAQKEAEEVMSARKNVLKPGNNDLVINSKLDIILGTYWATKLIEEAKGEGKAFSSPNDAISAYEFGVVDFRAKIKVQGTKHLKYQEYTDTVFETTAGRLLFNSALPSDYPFQNKIMDKKNVNNLEADLIARYGIESIASILDDIKDFGFKYATKSGTTWSNDDLTVPPKKPEIISDTVEEVRNAWRAYNKGLITEEERKRKNVELWFRAKEKIEGMIEGVMDQDSSVYDMTFSGSRGNKGNLSTMVGMKGIVSNVMNEAIEHPVKSSIKEGLDPIEYFITTHGSRKGLADTALNTAKAGYLTRKLFDVAQDVIITKDDCGTQKSITITSNGDGFTLPLSKTARGRYVAETIKNSKGDVLFRKGHFISILDAQSLDEEGVEEIKVRSPMTCELSGGVCQKCYGMDMGGDQVVDLGETIGTIAAQAIGEPGTQLTMRTFHSAGAASREGDITMGLPRIEEIFERRKPKIPAVTVKKSGEILKIEKEDRKTMVTILTDEGTKKEQSYTIPLQRMLTVKEGQKVSTGELMTDGSANLEEMLKYSGKEKTQEYIISETVKIYELQGSSVARKHIEVIIRQMFSRSIIEDEGDSEFIIDDIIENSELEQVNNDLIKSGKTPASAKLLIRGISDVSLSRKSWLSAVSFQHSVRMLINASLKGAVDPLKGLKERVIVGDLINAGTNYVGSKKYQMIKDLQDEIKKEEEEKMMAEEAGEEEIEEGIA
ncbi:MAG: DNA-directed RNA polymerase subunit beta' [Candidatus Pacebacteria bacterium]|nr:DNA-directed RNA polymerase subunit beta' [Candidatus Paceibacterota bacterium]